MNKIKSTEPKIKPNLYMRNKRNVATTFLGTTLLCATSLVALNAQADTIFGIYAGAGAWNSDFDGELRNGDNVDTSELGIDGDINNFLYIAVEHPVPVLPNVRLAIMDLSTEATATTDAFSFDGTNFPDGATTNTTIDLSHSDITLYWEVLDNWINLDLGLTGRVFDGEVSIDASANGGSISETVSLEGVAPLAYAKAKFELPFTGWSIGSTLNYLNFDGNSFTDFEANVGYTHDGLVLDLGVELGYRTMVLDTEELDDLEADLTMDGPYASIVVHF